MGGITDALFGGGPEAPQQVGPTFEQMKELAMPWGVQAPGIGTTVVDEEGRTISTTIDPRMAALAERLLGRAETQMGMITGYDPAQAARDYYQQYVAPDLLRGQEQERLTLENRLLAQGMLGSTGGALRSRALGEAQQTSQRQARGEAFSQAQNMLDLMRSREAGDIASAYNIYAAPTALMQTGVGVGQNMGQLAASYRPQYAPASSGGGGGLFGGLLGGLAGGAGGVLGEMAGGWLGSKIF